ncbi:hypothetical protein JYU34_000107 [Plutella xylostella]|uniref:Reverse transcriptase domain-containing protein n=1 Tax=Plutella xylostella TaxID=51655 RepID=A0ABQ7R6W1_PLUXY|nr:hypothetical protein JYU34_000107 [Plutella xylostella]
MDSVLSNMNEIDSVKIAHAFTCDIDKLNKHILVKNSNLTIISQNIRSIYANFDDLQLTLASLDFNVDILVLTECRLSENTIPKLDNYTSYYTTHHLNQNDGVVIYINSQLTATVKEVKLVQASCLQVELKNMTVLGIYRSPSNKNADLFINSLSSQLDTIKSNKNIIITGDININIIPKQVEDTYERNNRINYLDILSVHGLLPGHQIPTREKNCLDHFMLKIDNTAFSAKIAVLNTTITDHAMIFLNLSNCKPPICNTKTKTVLNFPEALNTLKNQNIGNLLFSDNPNFIVEQLINKINISVNDNTKLINIPKSKRTLKPWMSPGILRCIKNRNRMQKNLKKDKNNEILDITYKRYRNFCNNLIKKIKRKYDRDKLAASSKCSKALWKNIKNITHLTKDKNNNEHLLKIKQTPIESINYVNDFFSSIGKSLAEDMNIGAPCYDNPSVSPNSLSSFVLLDTSVTEVYNILMNLKNDCAPGWDNVSTQFLKFSKDEVIPVICHLINVCLTKGIFPTNLKQSIITPVFKGGDKADVNDYRPISVLPTISKILEKIINKRLINYLDKFNIISKSQYGFRQGKSTEDAVAALSSLIVNKLDNGLKCLTVFLDLKKAFDTVSIPILLKKLEQIGIRGVPLNLLTSYLTDRKQSVKIGQYVSNTTDVEYGVPQGSVLGPTLFLIYINEICNLILNNGQVFSYADDTALVFYAHSWDEVKRVSEIGLALVSEKLRSNLLTLNIKKTNYLCFSIYNNSQPDNNFNLKIHRCGKICCNTCDCLYINKVHSVKYLGVVIDQRLSWYSQIEAVTVRLRKMIWIFKKLRHVATQKLLTDVYISLAQSVTMYCISIWGGTFKTKFIELERAQRSLIKVIFFKPYRYSTELLYSNSHLLTVRKLYVINIILRFHKTLHFNPEYLNKRRKDLIIPAVFKNTVFASRQYETQSAHIYKQLQKILNIYPVSLRECKKIMTSHLDKLNYDETEDLLQYKC